jgi:hypothetical protein
MPVHGTGMAEEGSLQNEPLIGNRCNGSMEREASRLASRARADTLFVTLLKNVGPCEASNSATNSLSFGGELGIHEFMFVLGICLSTLFYVGGL